MFRYDSNKSQRPNNISLRFLNRISPKYYEGYAPVDNILFPPLIEKYCNIDTLLFRRNNMEQNAIQPNHHRKQH